MATTATTTFRAAAPTTRSWAMLASTRRPGGDRPNSFTFELKGATQTITSDVGVAVGTGRRGTTIFEYETDTTERVEQFEDSQFDDTFNINETFSADEGNFVSLRLREGNDTVNNSGAAVRVDYSRANAAVDVNFTTGVAQSVAPGDAAGIGVDTLIGVHRVQGSAYDDILTGTNSGSIYEEFRAQAGNDTIDGVGGTNNYLRYSSSPSGVNVNFLTGTAQDGYGTTDSFSNINHVRGSNHDDILVGDDNGNWFRPGTGDDDVTGNGGFDTGDYRFDSNAPITFTLSTNVTAVGADIGTDTYQGVERFKGGRGDDIYTADLNYMADYPLVLDQLGVHFNAFEGREGDDTINGNGITRIEYFSATSGINADLQAGTVTGDSSVGTDTVSGIVSIAGSAFDDQLRGSNNDPNAFRFSYEGFAPGEGNDFIDGRGGLDRLEYHFANNNQNIVVNLALRYCHRWLRQHRHLREYRRRWRLGPWRLSNWRCRRQSLRRPRRLRQYRWQRRH